MDSAGSAEEAEGRRRMTKMELNTLVEKLITIRDIYPLSMDARDALADACNEIYDNIETIAEDGSRRMCFETFKEYAEEIRRAKE